MNFKKVILKNWHSAGETSLVKHILARSVVHGKEEVDRLGQHCSRRILAELKPSGAGIFELRDSTAGMSWYTDNCCRMSQVLKGPVVKWPDSPPPLLMLSRNNPYNTSRKTEKQAPQLKKQCCTS